MSDLVSRAGDGRMSGFEELDELIKYLYYSDAIFHCMIVLDAEIKERKPYDSMLMFNDSETIIKLGKISQKKRDYENKLLGYIYKTPFKTFSTDKGFKELDEEYMKWNHKLEEFIKKTLEDKT